MTFWAVSWGWWLAAGSILTFAVGAVAIPLLIVRLPADYFTAPRPKNAERHPAMRTGLWLLANTLGLLLLLAGAIMLFTPGQGVLSIVVGLSLIESRPTRAWRERIVRQPAVLRAINSLRTRAGREPLIAP